MAEDKKIRVSADLSELRRLKEDITSLYREVHNSEEKSQRMAEEALDQLRKQLSLLTDKASLERMLADLKRKQIDLQRTFVPQPQQKEPSLEQQRERIEDTSYSIDKEKSSITWEIQPREKRKVSETETEESRKPRQPRISTSSKALEDLVRITRDTEKHVVSIRDIITQQYDERQTNPIFDDSILKEIRDELRNLKIEIPIQREELGSDRNKNFDRDEERISFGEKKPSSDNESLKDFDKINSTLANTRDKISSSIDNLSAANRQILDEVKLITRYLDTIGTSVSIIEDNSIGDKSGPSVGGAIGGGSSVKGGIAGGITAVAMQEVLKYGKQLLDLAGTRYLRNLRAEGQALYRDPISNVGLAYDVTGQNKADAYRWIPLVGNYISQAIETKYSNQGALVTTGLNALREAQNQVVSLAQTLGVSNSQALGLASREGSYAASALGMDIGEYGERRAQLIRASGGKITEREDAQSLMAAERLFGISSTAVNALQGSMRFNRNEDTTSSEVIGVFERTMKELKLPFEEIASTIEESLNTFNKTTEQILSRTGEIDAVRLSSVLAGVRSFTRAEGRQLERYQQAFTGQNISQDEMSQAFLQRSYFERNPGKSLSDFEIAKEDWTKGENLETLYGTIEDIQQSTGYNKEATFQALRRFFPGLTATDIGGLFNEAGEIDIDELANKIKENAKELAEKQINYSKDIATNVTGIEGLFKAYKDRMIAYGSENISILKQILEEVKLLQLKADVDEEYWSNLKEKTKGVDIFGKDDYKQSYRKEYQEILTRLHEERNAGKLTQEEFEILKERAYITALSRKLEIENNAQTHAMIGDERYRLGEYDPMTGTFKNPPKTQEEKALATPDINRFNQKMFPFIEINDSFESLASQLKRNTKAIEEQNRLQKENNFRVSINDSY